MTKTVIKTDKAPQAIGPYSQAVAVPSGHLIFCSGQIPLDPATGNMVEGDVTVQAERVMENIKGLLEACGVGFEHVVKSTIFLANMGDFAKVNEIYGKRFPTNPPSRSTVQAAALPRGALLEVEVIAVKG